MKTSAILLAALATAALPSLAPAQASLCGQGSYEMSWPDTNPVWSLCWRRARDSSGTFGSGLEIEDVRYKGKLVFKRAHAPVLNVQYEPGGCGGPSLCYRDWSDQEVRFQSDNVIFPGYSEPTSPPLTVCDTANGQDVGTFVGVAAEKDPTLILTTQMEAGWYRYTMKWYFELDGTIRTTFGFSAVSSSCVSYTHTHHNYWRLDFDIEGAGGDQVFQGRGTVPAAKMGREAMDKRASHTNSYWEVRDQATGRGYRIDPGPDDEPVDAFGVGDFWALAYRPSEIDDAGQPGPACSIKIGNFLTKESLDGTDVVIWYGGHALHLAQHLGDCHIVGPTMTPIGSW